jgi:hypothetical protein
MARSKSQVRTTTSVKEPPSGELSTPKINPAGLVSRDNVRFEATQSAHCGVTGRMRRYGVMLMTSVWY